MKVDSSLTRSLVTLGYTTLATLALALPAFADTTITIPSEGPIGPWGNPAVETIGQTITVPTGEAFLTDFTFRVLNSSAAGSPINFQGHVFAWDGSRATGSSLFSSPVMTTPTTLPGDITINTGHLPVTAGLEYVLFISTTGLQPGQPETVYSVGSNFSKVYTDGLLVFQNSFNDPTNWTTAGWGTFSPDADMAMTAHFTAAAAPEPSSFVLLALGAALGAARARRRTR